LDWKYLKLKRAPKQASPFLIPAQKYTFEEKDIKSKSVNSAFTGKQLKGKVVGIVNGNNIYLN
jgi:dihydroorotase-like cyclic amidohydrolase